MAKAEEPTVLLGYTSAISSWELGFGHLSVLKSSPALSPLELGNISFRKPLQATTASISVP